MNRCLPLMPDFFLMRKGNLRVFVSQSERQQQMGQAAAVQQQAACWRARIPRNGRHARILWEFDAPCETRRLRAHKETNTLVRERATPLDPFPQDDSE